MFFLLYIKCVGAQRRYLTIVHIKKSRKDGCRYKKRWLQIQKKDYSNKKGRSFHKFLPQVWQEADLPLKQKLFLILDLLYVSIDYSYGCDVYDILYTAL